MKSVWNTSNVKKVGYSFNVISSGILESKSIIPLLQKNLHTLMIYGALYYKTPQPGGK